MNHVTRREDVDQALDFLERHVPRSRVVKPSVERDVDLARSWLRRQVGEATTDVDPSVLGRLAVFADLGVDDAAKVAGIASTLRVDAGSVVIREWDVTRDFFVIVEGVATVAHDGSRLADLRTGEFFGELGAHDWGRGYGYARTATVTASTDLVLLVFPDGALDTLTRLSPSLAAAVNAAVATRLPG